jgi:hypothetical protein
VGFFKRIWGSWKSIEGKIIGRMEITFSRTDDARIIWLQGIGWAVAGGSLAGLCLVFTKAVVKIYYEPGHPVSNALLNSATTSGLMIASSYIPHHS